MKINFEHAHIGAHHEEEAIKKLSFYQEELRETLRERDRSKKESSILTPFDESAQEKIRFLSIEKGDEVRFVFVIGIGGSSLGAEAIYQALGRGRIPQEVNMYFIETVDSRQLEEVREIISSLDDPTEALVCVISKSGQTTETAANADIIYRILLGKFGKDAKERVVVISDEDSDLFRMAGSEGIDRLPIPRGVGGRYSVFSAVGLFPLYAALIDIDGLIHGAMDMLNATLYGEDNSALLSATALAYHYEQGANIHDLFVFDPGFESLGKWYRQLLGESIGKTKAEGGGGVRVGITPTVSVGSTDLHSVGQLYFGGPKGQRLTTFVRRGVAESEIISENGIFSLLVRDLGGKSSEEVLSALALGSEEAYIDAGLPFIDVFLEEANEYELGQFMQWKMLEVMFLGVLLGVDPFDQPAVESYKESVRRLLSE